MFSLGNHFKFIPGNAGLTESMNSVPKWGDYGAEVVYSAIARRRWLCNVYTTASVELLSLMESKKAGCVRQCLKTAV